jgi:uncharacterized protein (DUF1800 family)
MTMQRRLSPALISLVLLCGLAAQHANAAPPTRGEAFRFLNQTTFGPTSAEIDRLIALGDSSQAYARWIDEQMTIAPSLQLPVVQARYAVTKSVWLLHDARQDIWFKHAMRAPDQLRQRVAFALSEIMVVSEHSELLKMPFATADYYDLLSRSAFGDFRQLIEDVTLHPAMGTFLNMLANRKPDPSRNIRPDENYARELMQLFSIGLVTLNPDGSVPVDGAGDPFPTYDQLVIEGFAHVFTGWHYSGATLFSSAKRTNTTQVQPMKAYPEQHATGSKKLLSYPGVAQPVLPDGQTAQQDLEAALDNIFNHPNVGPFISRQLIQRLVASNPSRAYVARVAAVFNDDGQGHRGNLGAVVKAILLDPEARPAPAAMTDVTGKLKEPLLRLLQFWRAYDAAARNGNYRLADSDVVFGQGPQLSPTVFNFFAPAYAPPGEIGSRGLVAPEMQLANEALNTSVTNYFYTQIFLRNSTKTSLGSTIVIIDIADEMAASGNPNALVALIADKLLGGHISPMLAGEARDAVLRVVPSKPAVRATEALYLIATSPEFAVQR